MQWKTWSELVQHGRWSILWAMMKMSKPFYRITYLAGAAKSGILQRLWKGPMSWEEAVATWTSSPEERDGLEAWLQLGLRLGDLALRQQHYHLHSSLARALADPQNDALLAMVEEVVNLHHPFILHTPTRLKTGEMWTLSDQEGAMIARSSRVMEPFLREVIERIIPQSGAFRLFEVGCGSGIYIHHAARWNPTLTAVGLELQPEVAEMARQNIQQWGIADRVSIEAGDIRQHPIQRDFDVVTLHNNIYYFPLSQRVELLRHLLGFVKPGGALILTTACQGGSLMAELLNVWSASTRGCGRLPTLDEMKQQIREAGFSTVTTHSLVPGDRVCAFIGRTAI